MSDETRGHDDGGDEFTEDLEQTFAVGPAPTLRTRNVSGQTRIEVGPAGAIRVQARKRVRGSSAEKAKRLLQNVEVRMEQQGDAVEVRPHLYEQDRGWLDLFRGGRVTVDLRLTVPRECLVEAQTVSGDLRVEGVRGRLEVQSVSGDVTIAGTQGPLWVKSVSGDVSCGDFAGSVEANTVSGDVTFDRCRIRQCDVVTVSGDLSLDGALDGPDSHRIRTISGDVELALAGADYEIGFKTMSGDVELEAEGHVTRDGRRDRTILLGQGARGPRVQVKTVSGDLTVRAAHGEVPVAEAGGRVHAEPARPAPARRDDARAILERLARGELDVESAAAALDAARGA